MLHKKNLLKGPELRKAIFQKLNEDKATSNSQPFTN